jgi:IS30 family transposase
MTERNSRFTIVTKLSGKITEESAGAMTRIFLRLDPRLRRSTNFNNDTAFARYGLLRQALDLATRFCDA